MPALRSRKVRARSTSPQPQFRAGVSGAVGCLRAQARVSRRTTRSGFRAETRAERSRQRARAPSARIGSGNSHQGSTGKLRLVPQNTVFLRANQRSVRTEKLQLCPDRNRGKLPHSKNESRGAFAAIILFLIGLPAYFFLRKRAS